MRKVLMLVTAALLVATVPGAWADVQIYSSAGQLVHLNRDSGLGAPYNVAGDFPTVAIPRIAITPNVWADPAVEFPTLPATWISFTNTGQGGSSPTNDTPTNPLATFLNTFTLTSRHQGFLRVWADDTTSVRISPPGSELFPANYGEGTYCASGAIGCVGGAGGTGGSIFLDLGPGTYTLAFDTYQLHDDGYGLLYGANLTAVPEPTSLLLFGTAILGVAGLIRRRLR